MNLPWVPLLVVLYFVVVIVLRVLWLPPPRGKVSFLFELFFLVVAPDAFLAAGLLEKDDEKESSWPDDMAEILRVVGGLTLGGGLIVLAIGVALYVNGALNLETAKLLAWVTGVSIPVGLAALFLGSRKPKSTGDEA